MPECKICRMSYQQFHSYADDGHGCACGLELPRISTIADVIDWCLYRLAFAWNRVAAFVVGEAVDA